MSASLEFNQFKGMAPRLDPKDLPDGFSQTAANTKLIRGILQAWKAPSTVRATTSGIKTILRYPVSGTENWLCWSNDVNAVVNTVKGDTKQTVIWTDPTDGIPKHSRNDKLVFTGNYVKDTTDYFRLGVPAPTVAPSVAVTGAKPETFSIRTYCYAWAYRGNIGGRSGLMYVALAAGQTVQLTGLDTNAPVSTSAWPKAKETNFQKFIFQVDPAADKYILVGKVSNEVETWEDAGKTIKKYPSTCFKSANIAAPFSPTAVLSDTCSGTTGWTLGTGWTHGTGEFVHASGAAGDLTRSIDGFTVGIEYVLYLTTTSQTDGSFNIKLDSTALLSGLSVNQMQIVKFTASATSHDITIEASEFCDVHVTDLSVQTTDVEASAVGEATLDEDERKYVYCFTYQDATTGVPYRTTASAEASISGIADGASVLLTNMSATHGLPASIVGIKKRIFRKDKDTAGKWRLVVTLPLSQSSYEDKKKKSQLGKAMANWTLVASSAPGAPTLTQKTETDEELDKTAYSYVYTYVTAWGEESAPSPATATIELSPWEEATVTTGTTAPTNYSNVTLKRFYRTDSTGVFRVLFDQDITIGTASVVDDVEEADLGDAILTTDWDIPPGDSTTPLKGMCMLPNGVLCAGWGNQIGFSEPGYPYAWPIANQFMLDYPFVSAAVTANGVIVGTEGTPYMCQGNDPASMVPVRIEVQQACISGTTMVDMGDYVIYASPDGLVAVAGMDAQVITEGIMTRDQWQAYAYKADKSVSDLRAWYYERRYLLAYNTGVTSGCLMFDPEEKSLVSFTLAPTAGCTDLKTDRLYLQIGTNIQEWDAGSALTYTWRSGQRLLDQAINFAAARVQASAYPVTFKLYAGGTLRHTQTVANNRAFRLPGGYRDFDAEIELSGTADIRHVALATSMEQFQ